MTGVLRICTNTCDKAYLIALTVYIHIERIYRKLSHKLFSFVNDIEAAKHISSLKHRKLRLLDFVIPPAGLGKVCLRHLKSITKQCTLYSSASSFVSTLILNSSDLKECIVSFLAYLYCIHQIVRLLN